MDFFLLSDVEQLSNFLEQPQIMLFLKTFYSQLMCYY